MKAILVNNQGKLVWSDVSDPVMQEDDVIVEIYAAGVNRADLLQRQGKYPSPPGCPEWMGLEIAGVIMEVGTEAAEKSGWKQGDKVCALLGGGGYAEYVSVKYDMLMPTPRGLSLPEAAALPEAFATSYLNLFMEGNLKSGKNVYIPAGASGLASVAIPMAKAFDSRVITSVLSDEIARSITHLRADIIINSKKQNVADIFKEQMEAGYPVNIAMDCLGGESLGECLQYMAAGGTWVLISTLAGISTTVALRPVLTKGLRLVGSMLRNRPREVKAQILKELVEKVWPKIEAGEIRPTIYKTLPIRQAEDAHGILERSENIGKVVLILK
jgi:NADPH2:quinone reductase